MYAMVLRILRSIDTHVIPLTTVMDELTRSLTDSDALKLPIAIQNILPLLGLTTDQARATVSMAAYMDLFELAETAVEVAMESEDNKILMSAAVLCGNPATPASIRDRLKNAYIDDPMVQVRLDCNYIAQTTAADRLHKQLWPGHRAANYSYSHTPAAVIDCRLAPALVIRLAVSLFGKGFTVRRLMPGVVLPPWFGYQTVFVSKSEPSSIVNLVLSESGTTCVECTEDSTDIAAIVQQVTDCSELYNLIHVADRNAL